MEETSHHNDLSFEACVLLSLLHNGYDEDSPYTLKAFMEVWEDFANLTTGVGYADALAELRKAGLVDEPDKPRNTRPAGVVFARRAEPVDRYRR